MGLFDKLKNVLFEEEEVEIPVITKVETKPRVEPKVQPRRVERNTLDLEEEEHNYSRNEVKSQPKEDLGDFKNFKRDIDFDYSYEDEENEFIEDLESIKKDQIKDEPKSPFLSFDEDEFERLNSRLKDDELPKISRRDETTREVKKVAKKEIEVPKRFRPSPVISPVYGILDKNYKKEDISVRSDDFNLLNEVENAIDVDSVRRKAYGTLEDEIEDALNSTTTSKKVVEEPIFNENKSIDEMLKDTIDETIDIGVDITTENIDSIEEDIVEDKDLPTFEEIMDDQKDPFDDIEDVEEPVETPNDILEKTSTLKILDDIEKELDEVKVSRESKNLDDTDTDLFNLIDSMYEKEDGE